MSFEEYWQKLFGSETRAVIKTRENTVVLRLHDRHIAEYFWRRGFEAAVGEVKTSDDN